MADFLFECATNKYEQVKVYIELNNIKLVTNKFEDLSKEELLSELNRNHNLNTIHYMTPEGNALHFALCSKNVDFDLVKFLIENNVSMTYKNYDQSSPMSLYCENYNINLDNKIFDIFIDNEYNLDEDDFMLLLSNRKCTIDILDHLTKIKNQKISDHCLFAICFNTENYDVLEYVFNETVLKTTINPGYDLPHFIIMHHPDHRAEKLISIFLNHGYDPNSIDYTGLTILDLVLYLGRFSDETIINLMKKYDFKYNTTENWPTLLYACHGNKYLIAKYLIEVENLNINIKNSHDNTCLMFACMNNNFNLIQLLIKNGADVNVVDNDGDNALNYLCGCDNPNDVNYWYVKYMLDHGADYNIVSLHNETPIMYLCGDHKKRDKIKINVQVLKLLIDKGVKTNLINDEDKHYLDYLFENEDNCDLITELINEKYVNINDKDFIKMCYIKEHSDLIKRIENNMNVELHKSTEDKCLICYGDYVSGDYIIHCETKHCFHKECLLIWLQTSNKAKCPLCNKIIYPSDVFINE
jgi:ankyrin repeat protein